MLVGMWMTRDLVTVPPETPIGTVALTMSRRKVRRLLVTESRAGRTCLIGIVTYNDVAHAFPPDVNPFSVGDWTGIADAQVSTIMARRLCTTTPDTPLEEAARIMQTRKIGALPVVRDSSLAGIITESDVFQAFLEMTGVDAGGVRITFDVGEDEDVIDMLTRIGARHGMRLASAWVIRHREQMSDRYRRLAVVRLLGCETDALVEDVWRSGHRVISVLRSGR